MPVTRPATHPLRTPHTRRALRDSAEGASGMRGTRASDSSGFPLKAVPPWWPSRSGVTMFAQYKGDSNSGVNSVPISGHSTLI